MSMNMVLIGNIDILEKIQNKKRGARQDDLYILALIFYLAKRIGERVSMKIIKKREK